MTACKAPQSSTDWAGLQWRWQVCWRACSAAASSTSELPSACAPAASAAGSIALARDRPPDCAGVVECASAGCGCSRLLTPSEFACSGRVRCTISSCTTSTESQARRAGSQVWNTAKPGSRSQLVCYSWLASMEWRRWRVGKRVWDAAMSDVSSPQPVKAPLPSDARYRDDLKALLVGLASP